jgi:hypothetical protein
VQHFIHMQNVIKYTLPLEGLNPLLSRGYIFLKTMTLLKTMLQLGQLSGQVIEFNEVILEKFHKFIQVVLECLFN